MKVNFEIIENFALCSKGIHIDLHNNFDFVSFEYKLESRVFYMRWQKSFGDWVNIYEFDYLVLVHKNVNYLNIFPRDNDMPFSEDSCLMDITYFHSAHRDINDCSGDDKLPNEGDDIIYSFQSSQKIRINCDEIELVTS